MHIPDREPRLHGVLAQPCRKQPKQSPVIECDSGKSVIPPAWHRRFPRIPVGVSKLKLLCYNKEYEKTNDRGMEEMPEMWKDRKPGESRAQQLGEPTLQV